jgi:hypothetical protein
MAWTAAALLFYMNPLVAPLVMKHVTSPILYWRIFYLLPFPLVVGIAGAALTVKLDSVGRMWRLLVLGGALLLLGLAHLPESSSSVFRRGTRFDKPEYRVDYLPQVRELLALNIPPGTMIAPPGVRLSLTLLSSQYPQMLIRPDGIRAWMAHLGRPEEAEERIAASDFLGGAVSDECFDALKSLIKKWPQIRTVVASRLVAEAYGSELRDALEKQGFIESKTTRDLEVFIRREG